MLKIFIWKSTWHLESPEMLSKIRFGREAPKLMVDMPASGRKRKKCERARCMFHSQCKYYDNQVILILIASSFITSIISPFERVVADVETIKLNRANNRTVSDTILFNSTTVRAFNESSNEPWKNLSAATSFNNYKHQILDLITDRDHSHRFWTKLNQSDRHSYNISSGDETPEILVESRITNGSTYGDGDLAASDSRFIPKSASSRFDEDVEVIEDDGASSEETPSSDSSSTNSFNGASSNLSEQKVFKEMTKILSKGMSSAADQVGLDTLENLKRRQKKRKAIKETRAKLFEDLLNAAIVSHPEKVKKKTSRKRSGSKNDSSSKQNPYSYSTGSSSDAAGIDPDAAFETGSVLNYLQGLADLVEGQPSLGSGGLNSGNDEPAQDEAASGYSEEEHEPSGSHHIDGSTLTSPDTPDEPKKSKKTIEVSSDRPLVKQFKKFRKQISQRRKQLDQIKKLFNVDLALNPKDGTLMGKPSVSKKHKDNSGSTFDDDEALPSSNSRKRSGNSAKMRELMLYLKKNPEILASVMSELTVDADPTSQRSSSSLQTGNDDSSYHLQSLNLANTDSNSGSSRLYDGADSPDHIDRVEPVIHKSKKFTRLPQSFDSSQFIADSRRQARTSSVESIEGSLAKPLASLNRGKSAETLLLASLRERQLMNLARLESALAERQAASDRSQVFSSLLRRRDNDNNQSKAFSNLEPSATSTTAAPALQSSHQINNSSTPSHGKNLADIGGDMHHFVVTNNNNQQIDPQLIRQMNETIMAMRPIYQPNSQNNQPVSYAYSSAIANKLNDQTHSSFPRINDQHLKQQLQSTYGMINQQGSQIPPNQQVNNNLQLSYPRNQQQNSRPLSRFSDWRDVSQSETSLSQRSDRTNPGNVTWSPFDLSVGAISNYDHQFERIPNNHYATNTFWVQSSNQQKQSIPRESKSNYQPRSQNGNSDTLDSSVTRAHLHNHHDSISPSTSRLNEDEDSTRMPRASSRNSELHGLNSSDENDQIETNDDGPQQPLVPSSHQPTHVDYFSAYKRDWEDNRSRRIRGGTMPNKNAERHDINNLAHEGAIWAK